MDILQNALTVFAFITSGAAVIGIAISLMKKAKEPNEIQDLKIKDLEKENEELKKRIENIEGTLKKDFDRFERLEEGTIVLQECMLALLKHGIDGNEIEAMKQASTDLQKYLLKAQKR